MRIARWKDRWDETMDELQQRIVYFPYQLPIVLPATSVLVGFVFFHVAAFSCQNFVIPPSSANHNIPYRFGYWGFLNGGGCSSFHGGYPFPKTVAVLGSMVAWVVTGIVCVVMQLWRVPRVVVVSLAGTMLGLSVASLFLLMGLRSSLPIQLGPGGAGAFVAFASWLLASLTMICCVVPRYPPGDDGGVPVEKRSAETFNRQGGIGTRSDLEAAAFSDRNKDDDDDDDEDDSVAFRRKSKRSLLAATGLFGALRLLQTRDLSSSSDSSSESESSSVSSDDDTSDEDMELGAKTDRGIPKVAERSRDGQDSSDDDDDGSESSSESSSDASESDDSETGSELDSRTNVNEHPIFRRLPLASFIHRRRLRRRQMRGVIRDSDGESVDSDSSGLESSSSDSYDSDESSCSTDCDNHDDDDDDDDTGQHVSSATAEPPTKMMASFNATPTAAKTCVSAIAVGAAATRAISMRSALAANEGEEQVKSQTTVARSESHIEAKKSVVIVSDDESVEVSDVDSETCAISGKSSNGVASLKERTGEAIVHPIKTTERGNDEDVGNLAVIGLPVSLVDMASSRFGRSSNVEGEKLVARESETVGKSRSISTQSRFRVNCDDGDRQGTFVSCERRTCDVAGPANLETDCVVVPGDLCDSGKAPTFRAVQIPDADAVMAPPARKENRTAGDAEVRAMSSTPVSNAAIANTKDTQNIADATNLISATEGMLILGDAVATQQSPSTKQSVKLTENGGEPTQNTVPKNRPDSVTPNSGEGVYSEVKRQSSNAQTIDEDIAVFDREIEEGDVSGKPIVVESTQNDNSSFIKDTPTLGTEPTSGVIPALATFEVHPPVGAGPKNGETSCPTTEPSTQISKSIPKRGATVAAGKWKADAEEMDVCSSVREATLTNPSQQKDMKATCLTSRISPNSNNNGEANRDLEKAAEEAVASEPAAPNLALHPNRSSRVPTTVHSSASVKISSSSVLGVEPRAVLSPMKITTLHSRSHVREVSSATAVAKVGTPAAATNLTVQRAPLQTTKHSISDDVAVSRTATSSRIEGEGICMDTATVPGNNEKLSTCAEGTFGCCNDNVNDVTTTLNKSDFKSPAALLPKEVAIDSATPDGKHWRLATSSTSTWDKSRVTKILPTDRNSPKSSSSSFESKRSKSRPLSPTESTVMISQNDDDTTKIVETKRNLSTERSTRLSPRKRYLKRRSQNPLSSTLRKSSSDRQPKQSTSVPTNLPTKPKIESGLASVAAGTAAAAARIGFRGSMKAAGNQAFPPLKRRLTLITPKIDDEEYIEVSNIESDYIGVDVDGESPKIKRLRNQKSRSNNSRLLTDAPRHPTAERAGHTMTDVLSENNSAEDEDSEDEVMAHRSRAALLGGHAMAHWGNGRNGEVRQAHRLTRGKQHLMVIQSDDESVEVSDVDDDDDCVVAFDGIGRGGRLSRAIDVVASAPEPRSPATRVARGSTALQLQLALPVKVGKPRLDPRGIPPTSAASCEKATECPELFTTTTTIPVRNKNGIESAVVPGGDDAVQKGQEQFDNLSKPLDTRRSLEVEIANSPTIEDTDVAEKTKTNECPGIVRSAEDSFETVEFIKTTKYEVGLDGRRKKITQETRVYADGSTEVNMSKSLI